MIRTTNDGCSHTPCPLSAHGVCLLPWVAGVLGLACLTMVGCGRGPAAKVMQGSVTCGGQDVPGGKVSFVPLDGDSAWICVAQIVDGKYRIDARGGVPLGKYRVQVDARKKTGRKVKVFNGIEKAMMDEEVRMGLEGYANQNSPLVVEVLADSDGRFDIAIPPK
jgi:hypothetical protein